MNFLKKNWPFIVIGTLSLLAGYLLNSYANKKSEERIIKSLIAEIKSLKNNLL